MIFLARLLSTTPFSVNPGPWFAYFSEFSTAMKNVLSLLNFWYLGKFWVCEVHLSWCDWGHHNVLQECAKLECKNECLKHLLQFFLQFSLIHCPKHLLQFFLQFPLVRHWANQLTSKNSELQAYGDYRLRLLRWMTHQTLSIVQFLASHLKCDVHSGLCCQGEHIGVNQVIDV